MTLAIEDRGWPAIGWLAAFLVVVAKFTFEAISGQVLLPTSAPPGVTVVGVTHIVGLATGALAAMVALLWCRALSKRALNQSRRLMPPGEDVA